MGVAAGTNARRGRAPQGEGGRLRAELIAAAGRILDRSPDQEALTLRAVAREAGVAAPSVYLHFASKDALILAVVATYFVALREAIEQATATTSEPVACLRAACFAYCDFAVAQPGAYRVLFGTIRPPLLGSAAEQGAGVAAFQTLVSRVGACMAAGLAPPGDPFRVATSLWTALHGIVSLRRFTPSFPWPPLSTLVDDAIVGLVGVERAAVTAIARETT